MSRPDILFLVLDTQRADRLSCYGYDKPTSPHLDALAADATRFAHAMASAQWTVPSHTSMFTGTYPSVHRTQHANSVVPPTLPTLAERLRAGGYYTAAFCNNPLVGVVNNGLRRGFLSFLNYAGWLTSRPNQAGEQRGLIGRYRQWFKRRLAVVMHFLQDSFARSDALLAFAFTPIMIPLWQTALSFKGNTAKSLDDAARLLIERNPEDDEAAGRPIFAFVNLMGTHTPYQPRQRHLEQFAPNVLYDRAAQRYMRRFNADPFGWMAPVSPEKAAAHRDLHDGLYDAEVANQDEYLGEFFDKLRKSGRLDEMLVIIVADHGEHLGEKGQMGHSFMLYRELAHVPLIVRDPSGALARGTVVDEVVSTRRLFHTVLDAAGLADEAEQPFSLRKNISEPNGDDVFAEAVPPSNVLAIMQQNQPESVTKYRYDLTRRAVWHASHKLVRREDDDQELYDYLADPAEMQELSDELVSEANDLRERVLAFKRAQDAVAAPAQQSAEQSDPQVQRRLKALGYLE